ncbi:cupin domain-containing protein [Massilia arenosa]|uniref:Cupin domain-containing protein n=1 Tax=Zemynaea arenosa TaxID=2561931 RepID=A0A4Y9RXN5_9BURK|nr:cupin domain-containing protein [Massilia arenosa]TFW13653.1 cupin domain-containing protein [Massilia arenosa]
MLQAVSPLALAARIDEYFSPRVIAELDNNYVKLAKLKGTFGWHAHEHEDELFMVIQGRLRIDTEHGSVQLEAGELYVVPKGVRHTPVADQECVILLIEQKQTTHSGNEANAYTRSIADQLRSLD